jgi:hypothetical protein
MIRALGGNRPVGPACEFHYRAGRYTAQYDAVLRKASTQAPAGPSSGPQVFEVAGSNVSGRMGAALGHMA